MRSGDAAVRRFALKEIVMEGIPAELSRRIQDLIDEFKPDDSLGNWTMRVCKHELHALPLHGNWIYLWALRADGSVVCMDHEALSHPSEPETDPLVLYAVLTQGARIYPELEALAPVRPAGAEPCGTCAATGMVERVPGAFDSCLGCRGLGWR